MAAFSRHEEVLRWAEEKLSAFFGPIARTSTDFAFNQTHYYESSMGPGLRKRFLVFHDLISADQLADIKLRTNELEQELIQAGTWSESRPLNLDPGILSLGKFMLATTKDQSHRIYLRDGIFAEVTLRFQDHAFHPWPWTYADYRYRTYAITTPDTTHTLDGRALPGIPQHWLNLMLRVQPRRLRGVWTELQQSYSSGYYVNDTLSTRTAPWWATNVRAGWDGTAAGMRLAPFIGINNAFNHLYVSSVVINAARAEGNSTVAISSARLLRAAGGSRNVTVYVGLAAAESSSRTTSILLPSRSSRGPRQYIPSVALENGRTPR